MASIQCSQCKTGIHYHGEPSGIEYTFIKEDDWGKIILSRFDPQNKRFAEGSSVPMLYQTDTIESDFESAIWKAWRCPECGAIMFFDKHGRVIREYKENAFEKYENPDCIHNYVVFDDYSWDVLTNSSVPNWKLPEKFQPSIYAELTDSKLILIDTDRNIMRRYKRVMNIAEQLFNFRRTQDPKCFGDISEIDIEELNVIAIEILSWLKLERKREIWQTQGRIIQLKPMPLKTEYPWCKKLIEMLQTETPLAEVFCVEGNSLHFKDDIKEEYIHEARQFAYQNYNPQKIVG